MRLPSLMHGILVTALTLVALTTSALAATPHIINWGEVIHETGALPDNAGDLTEMEVMDFRAGYVCDHLGFFWAEIARWNCKTSIVMGKDTYATNPPQPIIDLLEKKYSEDDIQMNFWQQHGRWVLLGILLLYLGYGLFGGDVHDVEDEDDFDDELAPEPTAKPITGPIEWTDEEKAEGLDIGMTPHEGIPQLGDILQRESNAAREDGPPVVIQLETKDDEVEPVDDEKAND